MINFGWIGENGLEEKSHFYEYLKEDVKRNLSRIKNFISTNSTKGDDEIYNQIESKAKLALNEIKNMYGIKAVISWYDINSNNILVDSDSIITGFLDAGGARFAIREWDLAFIKMNLCNNKEEFSYFENLYSKNNTIDKKILNLLTIIVEIDDIAFQLETGIKLPIAFESNFGNIIETTS